MRRIYPSYCLIFILLFVYQKASATISERPDVQQFIQEMVAEHEFDVEELTLIFNEAKLSEAIVKAISRPAEAKPWYKYRPIFLTKDRIKLGVKFLKENEATLLRAEQIYGVPVEVIVAIIGVETRYGKHAGNYKVVNSLSTLAFNYPKRSKFFRSELKHFFLMTREQHMDPLVVKGSYAGAMGIPQFISSSFRNFAIDFDDDKVIDIWGNSADAIGSVGNYFKEHGWKAGQAVASPAQVKDDKYLAVLTKGLKPHMDTTQLEGYGISSVDLPEEKKALKFLEYELKEGSEFWLGFDNFYVITRYNHSALYAMAVFQLSQAIRTEYDAKYPQ